MFGQRRKKNNRIIILPPLVDGALTLQCYVPIEVALAMWTASVDYDVCNM